MSPKLVSVPDEFIRLQVSDRIAICEPSDREWVQNCLAHALPGTQPTTRPSDMLARLKKVRPDLQAQLVHQLDLKDPTIAPRFFDETLLPLAAHLDRLKVRIVYVVATRDDLKRLVMGGWGGDQFHYNRIADKIAFNGEVDISLDGSDGESLVPAPYLAGSSTDARTTGFNENIGRTEAGIADLISREAQSALQLSFAKFILQTSMVPLKLKLDQDWFGAGVAGYLSAYCMAAITDTQQADLVEMISHPDPRNPVAVSSIDLAQPIPPDQIRPQIAGAYADAYRRRSIAVVASWVTRAGPDAIAKVMVAIHATPPADGPALVQLILKTTKIDLSSDLPPR